MPRLASLEAQRDCPRAGTGTERATHCPSGSSCPGLYPPQNLWWRALLTSWRAAQLPAACSKATYCTTRAAPSPSSPHGAGTAHASSGHQLSPICPSLTATIPTGPCGPFQCTVACLPIVCQLSGFRHFSAISTTFASMCKHVVTWGGGGGMCILFEICKKTAFQKCMGWGRGVCHFSA